MQERLRAFSFTRLSRLFANDSRGAAAIEFIVILPVMLAFAFGTAEIYNLIAIDRKLTLTARTISDIVAQGTAISDAEMANVLNTGKVLLQPYPETGLKLRVSAVKIDADKNATIEWSDAFPAGEARPEGAVTIPPALLVPNTQLIWGEVAYDYRPGFGDFALKTLWPLTYEHNQFFARPRESTIVCRPACT